MTAQLPSRWKLKKIIETADQIIAEMAKSSSSDEWAFLNDDMGTPSEVKALAEFALAAHEQEPVAYADPQAFDNFKSNGGNNAACTKEWMWRDNANGLIPLYTHPAPVPAVPVAYRWNYGGSTNWRLTEKTPGPGTNHKCPRVIQALAVIPDCIVSNNESVPAVPDERDENVDADDHPLLWSFNEGWNACRAAMLSGGKS